MQHEDEGHEDERHERHEEQTPVMKGFAPSCFLQPGAALFRAAPNQTMIPVRIDKMCLFSPRSLRLMSMRIENVILIAINWVCGQISRAENDSNPKKLFALLIGVILLSMWSNAIAAMFCPQMSGNHDRCLMQLSHEHDDFADTDVADANDSRDV